MKNKVLFLGSLCLILVLGLVFIGCDDGAVEVDHPDTGEFSIRVSRAGDGAAAFTAATSINAFLVAWSSAEEANYQTVFRPVGKVSYVTFNSNVAGDNGENTISQNSLKFTLNVDKTEFDQADNTDVDEWASSIDVTDIRTAFSVPAGALNVTGQFGVIAFPFRADRNPIIVWDDVEYVITLQ